MNKSNLKSYAPPGAQRLHRRCDRPCPPAGLYGHPRQRGHLRGDVLIIDGVEWPAKVAGQRAKLLESYLKKLRLALLDVIESGQKARLQ